jgi:UDP-GlcNAc:undecaprenyl-phosphate/decaprenyl-phosphate GlcNAc-1-phosphate transferase
MPLFLAFVAAVVLTVLLVPVALRIAHARGFVTLPSADRWNPQPVPTLGGLAMLLALLAVLAGGRLLGDLWPVALASTLMFALGMVDDRAPLRPATKVVAQMGVAGLLLALLPPIRLTGDPTVDFILGFAWIVGITNAVNLLDNIDGLAAGVAGIAGTSFLLVLVINAGGPTPLAIAMAAFVGVMAGFLLYNFQPASIFMGDSGSHLVGSFLAGATLAAAPTMQTHLAPVIAVPIVLLLIPIFDTAFVTLTRGFAGRSAFLGGRDHTSHRLVALGMGERQAVLLLYALTAVGGAVAVGLVSLPPGLAWGFVAIYVSGIAVLGLYLGNVHVHLGSMGEWQPLPSEVTSRYRVYEVALDLVLICAAYYLAFVARFREPQFSEFLPYFTRSLPIVVVLQLGALWVTGKYRQVWRSLDPSDLLGLFRGALLGVALSVIAVLYLSRFEGYSRWVFAFDAVLAPMLIVTARVVLSAIDDYLRLRRSRGRTALIYGAGRGGSLAVRELLQNSAFDLTPVGFIDDDVRKRRMKIDGLVVRASLGDLAAFIDRRPVAAVIVAISNLPADRFDRLCDICASRGVAVRQMRFAIEDVRRPPSGQTVVRFPGA